MLTRLEAEYITWAQFEACHPDTQTAFENMCRMLFNRAFFAGKAKSVGTLYKELNNLQWLLRSPDLIAPDDVGKKLLENKVLVVTGEAGAGKSQMFANATEQILKSGGCAILALGGQFLSNDSLEFQVPQCLGLKCDFSSLL